MDYNPYLTGVAPGGRGEVEKPGNVAWQTRAAPPTDYENRLADALERAFGRGIESLAEVVAALNGEGSRDPAGSPWTEASLQAELRRLGG